MAAGTGLTAFEELESLVVAYLLDGASYLGVQPASRPLFGTFVGISWLLVLVGFSPVQMTGFGIYLLLAPFAFLFLFVYRHLGGDVTSANSDDGPGALRLPLAASAAFLCAAWIVLYGGASTANQVMPGVISSGVLLVVLTYRSFLRVRPIGKVDVKLARSILQLSSVVLDGTEATFKRIPLDRVALSFNAKQLRLMKWIARRTALWVRGPRGQSRVHALLALDYLWSLIALVGASTLFWATVIVAASPKTSLWTALQSSASRVLPGLPMPQDTRADPWWIAWGLSLTAWLLLILFIGPASSLLPARQQAYSQRLAEEYAKLRAILLLLKRTSQSVESAIARLSGRPKSIAVSGRASESNRDAPKSPATGHNNEQGSDRELKWDDD